MNEWKTTRAEGGNRGAKNGCRRCEARRGPRQKRERGQVEGACRSKRRNDLRNQPQIRHSGRSAPQTEQARSERPYKAGTAVGVGSFQDRLKQPPAFQSHSRLTLTLRSRCRSGGGAFFLDSLSLRQLICQPLPGAVHSAAGRGEDRSRNQRPPRFITNNEIIIN